MNVFIILGMKLYTSASLSLHYEEVLVERI